MESTQFEIIQEIANCVLLTIEDGWKEIVIKYYVQDSRSGLTGSYLLEEGGAVGEKSFATPDDLDFLFRKLRSHLSVGGKQSFTKCVIHINCSGKFNASYEYEEVDWDELLQPGWNFPVVKKDGNVG